MKLIDADEVMNQIQNIQIQNIIDDDRYRFGVSDECRFVDGFTVAQLIIEIIANVQGSNLVKYGRWIDDPDFSLGYFANCSECGYQIDVHENRGYFNFCPHCGSYMRGQPDDIN